MSDEIPPPTSPALQAPLLQVDARLRRGVRERPRVPVGQDRLLVPVTSKPHGPDGDGRSLETCRDPQRAASRSWSLPAREIGRAGRRIVRDRPEPTRSFF